METAGSAKDEQRRKSLKRAAEEQMGRRLPSDDDFDESHPVIGRFKYDAVRLMSESAKGFFLTCMIRRERSCAREASTSLLKSETQLPSAKLSARGVVFLLADAEDSDSSVLNRVRQVYDCADEDLRVDFTLRMVPVLRTAALDDGVPAKMEHIGADLARAASSVPIFGMREGRKEMSLAVAFNGRKLCPDEVKQRCITMVAKGFANACPSGMKVRVDLKRPDTLICVEVLDVMARTFFLVGVAPSPWLAEGTLRLKVLRTTGNGSKDETRKENFPEEE